MSGLVVVLDDSPTPSPAPWTPSMPADVLLRILEHSDSAVHSSDRAAHFASLSLIAKAWTAPARRLLWREVVLSDRTVSKCLASSAFGKYPARLLEVNGPGVTPEDVVALVAGCKGVRVLDLYQVELRASTLALPSLAGLQFLILGIEFFHWQGRIPDSLPFQLRSLSVSYITNPTSFLPLLLAACATLTTLTIPTLIELSVIHTLLSHLGPQLLSLSLPSFSHSRSADAFAPLKHCRRLARLKIRAERDIVLNVLESLPETPTLRTLTIKISTPKEALDRALRPLRRCLSLSALEKLEEIKVEGVEWESVSAFESAKIVRGICGARRIRFVVAPE